MPPKYMTTIKPVAEVAAVGRYVIHCNGYAVLEYVTKTKKNVLAFESWADADKKLQDVQTELSHAEIRDRVLR